MAESEEITLILIGEPGKGKSSSGNTILGNKVFGTRDSEGIATAVCDFQTCQRNNTTIQVIDTPGIEKNDDDTYDLVRALSVIAQAIRRRPNGFGALIFVKKYGDRWTRSETNSIDFLKTIFGLNCLYDFGVVVYTHGDQFYERYRDTKTFAQWIQEDSMSSLSIVNAECNNRFVLFDNDLEGSSTCVTELLDVIRRTIRGRLLSEHIQEDKTFREHLLRQYPSADLNIQLVYEEFHALLNKPFRSITFERLMNAAQNFENSFRDMPHSQVLQRLALDIKRKIHSFSENISLEDIHLIMAELNRLPYILPNVSKPSRIY